MVSFWPFGREDANSPKSFEKSLALLSDKIQRLQVRDETLRATHRRIKVLFTLYSSFIYILVFFILLLVTGYDKWSATEWTAVGGSPVGIILVRYVVDLYFDWREGNVRARLERKVKERDVVIKKLKDAMRYDSTQELLDKYGGSSSGRKDMEQRQPKAKASHSRQSSGNQAQRTGFAPPPTANIPGRNLPAQNAIDARLGNLNPSPLQSASHSRQPSAVSESFAPNAFEDWQRVPSPVQNTTSAIPQPARSGFLDRMLDLIVGEDESAPRNRIVLLCTSCRTVNGQAPPGTRSLQEVGKWRCSTCHAWNGVESEVNKIMKEVKTDKPVPSIAHSQPVDQKSQLGDNDGEQANQQSDEELDSSTTPAGSTRSKARQRRAS